MRILLLTSSMSAGGAERVASTLASAWAQRGDDVVLMPTFSGRGECFYELSSKVRLLYLADLVPARDRSLFNQFARLVELRRFIAAERPQVIVSFLPNVNVAALIAAAGLSIPVVICERTDPFVCPLPRSLQLACRFFYPFAQALTVQTNAVAGKYGSSKRGLSRVWVIPNPVPKEMLDVERSNAPAEDRRLLAVGRLSEEKQFDVLILAFAGIAARHTEWSLRIVGEGPLRSALEQRIAELGLEARIALPGRTPNICAELARADAFVLASRYEGFPNALLEAMAAGLPCISFDCPSGPREISRDGQVALLVGPNDAAGMEQALGLLMSDDDLRSELGAKARISVRERYALERVLAMWDSLFDAVGVRQ